MKFKNLDRGIMGGSLALLITMNLYFAFNYLFHFAMARMLVIAEYGILATLYSLMYILAVFSESIQLVISKYSTKEKDKGKLKNMFIKSTKKAVKYSALLFISFLVIAILLSYILKIRYTLIAFSGLVIFSSLLLPVSRGILQGKKRFSSLGINMILEAIVKLGFAVLLVYLGWKVYGAVAATVIGVFISLIFSYYLIKDILKSKEKKGSTPGIYSYTAPVFVAILCVILFYSLDTIIAKIFFHPDIAGQYAIASTISKIIFFGTLPISKAMFPISTESKTKKHSRRILSTSALFLTVLIIVALAIIFLFPDLIIRIFAGRYIPELASILIFPAIATSILGFTNLILMHKLSSGKTSNYYLLFAFIIIEIILLSTFNNSLLQFSIAFMTSSAVFLWGSLFLLNK